MFGSKSNKRTSKMAKNNDYDANSINTIGAGTTITGDIVSDGDFRIVGKLIGTIHSKGKVVIGKNGLVEGEIICKNADISGKVKGNIKVEELLSLSATSTIEGEITTSRLGIEAGAIFTGQCQMKNTNEQQGRGKK